MIKRGFTRTTQEYRSKAKTMRLNYKYVLSNMKWSGAGYATCPYFGRLHSILRGDASVTLQRVADSLLIIREQPLPVPAQQTAIEEIQDVMTLHLTPVVEETDRSSGQGEAASIPKGYPAITEF